MPATRKAGHDAPVVVEVAVVEAVIPAPVRHVRDVVRILERQQARRRRFQQVQLSVQQRIGVRVVERRPDVPRVKWPAETTNA
jgi:hypothetical protein